jgi:hypothetical protein
MFGKPLALSMNPPKSLFVRGTLRRVPPFLRRVRGDKTEVLTLFKQPLSFSNSFSEP